MLACMLIGVTMETWELPASAGGEPRPDHAPRSLLNSGILSAESSTGSLIVLVIRAR